MNLSGQKTAIITGITKGIGRAIALKFAGAGIDLIGCSRNLDELNTFKKDLHKDFPNTSINLFQADLSKPNEVEGFGHYILEVCPAPEILINNAALFQPGGIVNEKEGNLEYLMQVNLFSAYHLTRAVAPTMMARKSGFIANLCSVASIRSFPGNATYSITKYAMLGFSRSLRDELKPYGVRVSSILPGATYTAAWEGVDVAVDRLMNPADVADAIFAAYQLGPSAVIEEILIRPQLGDL